MDIYSSSEEGIGGRGRREGSEGSKGGSEGSKGGSEGKRDRTVYMAPVRGYRAFPSEF